MSSLPLKAKVAVRDHWSKADGALQTSLKGLKELLGLNVTVEPEWQLLITELDTFYEDNANLVTIVAGCVQTWVKCIVEVLDDPAREEWTATLLDKVWANHLPLYIEISSSGKGWTTWSEQQHGFVISLPKKKIYQPSELVPVFQDGLLTCFEAKKDISAPSHPAAADDWADIEVDAATGKTNIVEIPARPAASQGSAMPKVDYLPDMSSLPRPNDLFLKPPFHLIVSAGLKEIEIQGSHSPSLQLLAEYFKRWCRVNHQDTRKLPAAQIQLHQSAFGFGEMFDRLRLSTVDTRYTEEFRVTAPAVLALVEGVLGYELVSSHHGTWVFRRNTEYKSL